jgi:hypothetical protein
MSAPARTSAAIWLDRSSTSNVSSAGSSPPDHMYEEEATRGH